MRRSFINASTSSCGRFQFSVEKAYKVRYLIPNQIEVNRTEVRRVLTVKYQAYPQKIAAVDKIANPTALNQVGGVVKVTETIPATNHQNTHLL